MKNSPLTTFLLTVLTCSAVFSVVACYFSISKTREMRQLQTTVGGIEGNRRTAAALVNEAMEYSKKNPAIDPILEQAGLKPKPGSASTTKSTK
jgi:hypothetical protein